MATDAIRAQNLRSGVRVEIVTVAWMVVEAVVAIGSGILARSVLLTAFGFDSVVELISGGVLLWRLRTEARGLDHEAVEGVERRAGRAAVVLLVLLCVYLVGVSLLGALTRLEPERSLPGIAIAAASVVVMPVLSWRKRRIAERIRSGALRADAAESITCAYMAGVVLLGVALNATFGWWWAEYAAAIPFLWWLVGETREAFESARGRCWFRR